MLAIEFGKKYDSCDDAVTARAACPVGTTQKQFYEKYCDRGDWLFWQLEKLSDEKRQETKHLVEQALDIIIDRDIASRLVNIKDIDKSWAVHLRTWGAAWLDGTDRSYKSASAAGRAAERAAESDVERGKQTTVCCCQKINSVVARRVKVSNYSISLQKKRMQCKSLLVTTEVKVRCRQT